MINFGTGTPTRNYSWTTWKSLLVSKAFNFQYDDDGVVYTIYGYDDDEVTMCTIWNGTVPDGIIAGGYTQNQNDTDKTDFETFYKSHGNTPVIMGGFNDPRITRKIGNMNLTSSLEFTVAARPYVEQQSQAQRSVISTSTSDTSPAGAGARKVRIIYLDSNYAKKQEDVALNGTAGVNTVATDIRFIESFEVIEGTNAVGLISIMSGVLGTGSAVAQIGAATTQAFLCHHYVPSGSTCFVIGWGATTDRDTSMKLGSQSRSGSFLVDKITDLYKLYGVPVGSSGLYGVLGFDRKFSAVKLDPMTYVKVTTTPSGTYSTTVRSYLDIWEL